MKRSSRFGPSGPSPSLLIGSARFADTIRSYSGDVRRLVDVGRFDGLVARNREFEAFTTFGCASGAVHEPSAIS
jgi:hypothetical protein